MSFINADWIIRTVPSVISPSGQRLAFNGLCLTDSTRVPIGSLVEIYTIKGAEAYFGASSTEATLAANYFNGFDTSTKKPGLLYFAQQNTAAVAAYLRGGSMAGITLAQLKTYTGTLTITVDAETHTTASIDLSGATSFSNAATIISAALAAVFTVDPVCTYDSTASAFVITSATTGATSIITYATGTIAASLKLQAAQSAVTSQGAAIAVVSTLMNAITDISRNWSTFFTSFTTDNTAKLDYSVWANAQNLDYAFLAWSTTKADIKTYQTLMETSEYNGTSCIYGDVYLTAAVSGFGASIDLNRSNGWIDFMYKSQAGLTPLVTTTAEAEELDTARVNFYGRVSTRSQQENMFARGTIAGAWLWLDDFFGQMYLRDAFQNASFSFLTQINRLPYNTQSYAQLHSIWDADVAQQAKKLGVIVSGIALDQTQKVLIDSLTGFDGSYQTVIDTGYFISITDPIAADRVARNSPLITVVYTSGQSIQKLVIPVVNAQ